MLFRQQVRRRTVEGGEVLDASVGTVLGGRYRIESTLGTGGMAVVYKAEDAILGRKVALKTLRPRYAEEPTFRRRFKQEARAMASLDHENIVKVYDIAQDGDAPFIVAEYVKGYDVGDLLKRSSTLNEQFARRISEQLLGALAYAHRRGIIHRDIKPSNILINTEGVVKVADFGIARIVEEDNPDTGEPGEIVGSARYMSPEQLQAAEAMPQSDIYSVGILLYHCLTGAPPFSGDVKSLARQHMKSSPRPPRKVNRKISPAMEAVILKALAKDPKDRYPSADAVLDDLEADFPRRAAVGTAEAPLRSASSSGGSRLKKLALASGFAVLLLGGGTALASTLGYVDLPGRSGLEAFSKPSTPADDEPVAAPEQVSDQGAEQESNQAPEQEANQAAEEQAAEEPESENVASREAEVAPVTEAVPEEEAPPAEMIPVPDVRTYYDYSAVEILNNRGFEAAIVYAYKEGYADRGVAWGTDPAIGTMAPAGSTITVYVTPEDFRQPQI
nr:serine/threonine protein kinase [Rubrobacter sp.]